MNKCESCEFKIAVVYSMVGFAALSDAPEEAEILGICVGTYTFHDFAKQVCVRCKFKSSLREVGDPPGVYVA